MKKILINVISAIFIIGVCQTVSVFAGSTLTVNWVGSGEACDNQLTLAEAAHLGRGGFSRPLTQAERNQISGDATFVPSPLPPECAGSGWLVTGGLGSNSSDNIVFISGITATINYGITLGKNDHINGLSGAAKVILDGTGTAAGTRGIFIENDSGSNVRNLVIRDFPATGIFAQRMNGAVFEGLEIYGNGGGISLGFSGGINSRNVTIGGNLVQERNLIYGNGGIGILIVASATEDRFPDLGINILNNYIGTSNGTSDNGNSGNGIELQNAFGVTIGDPTGATRNIISGNGADGIKLRGAGAVSNRVIWNFIGVDNSGGVSLGNSLSGIALTEAAGDSADFISSSANRIGEPGFGNVISGNNWGIYIDSANTSNNWIQANIIGSNSGGNVDVGNALEGIFISTGTYDNLIGGTGTNEGNLIAFNRIGILANGSVRNAFRRNRMFGNDLLGIDLAPEGATGNDTGDGDTGPNNLQNYPVITNVNAQSASVFISGTFNSQPNQTYTLEFFGNTAADASGFGEGRNYLGSASVTTNASGNATFVPTFSVSLATVGSWVTATATDSTGNTSEFSQARHICAGLNLNPTSTTVTNAGGTGSFTVTSSAGCYTAQSNASWITLGSTSGGTVNYTVAPNAGALRSGTISILYNNGAGNTSQNFTITQASGCTYSLNPTSVNLPADGGTLAFNVVASDSSCIWTASTTTTWITNVTPSGTGSGTVNYTWAANTSTTPRTGTITAAGQTLTLNQAGICNYSLNPTSSNIAAAGGNGSFNLTTTSGCAWTAVSQASWITVTGGNSGTGNGTINFSVAANTGPARSGTILAGGQTFTINQASGCSYSLNPTFLNVGRVGGNASFQIVTQTGCQWSASSQADWLTITSPTSGTGTSTISFSYASNPNPTPRSGTMTAGGQTFTVNQAAGCSYSLNNSSVNVPASATTGSFQIVTQSGCAWTVSPNAVWITITSATSGFGNATVSYSVAANTGVARSGTITAAGLTFTINQAAANAINRTPFDFDGDRKTDISIFRPAPGEWWYLRSSDGGNRAFTFGTSADKIVPGDYTGDGKTDVAFWRGSTGEWYILRSEDFSFYAFPFGNSTDIPVPADYDGDGRTDAAVFRASTLTWYIQKSTGGTDIISFGAVGDKPVVADYDGDGKADIAIFRPNGANGAEWWVRRSSNASVFALQFGTSTDKATQGDFTGDGKADVAFWRPSNGNWFILRSEDFSFYAFPFGASGDVPAPGDYDGDGRTDATVFRPSNMTWYSNRSIAGTLIQVFGQSGDQPVPNAFVP